MSVLIPSTATILCRRINECAGQNEQQQLSTILKIGHREHGVTDAITKLIDVSQNPLKRSKRISIFGAGYYIFVWRLY